jgi:hypothetical protein
MKAFDIMIYAIIALTYNLFVHNLSSLAYQDLQYEEKHNNTIIMLIIFGVIGIAVSKFINNKKKYDNKYVKNGLYYGGIILILTALLTNWTEFGGEVQLLAITLCLGLAVWYAYTLNANQ